MFVISFEMLVISLIMFLPQMLINGLRMLVIS